MKKSITIIVALQWMTVTLVYSQEPVSFTINQQNGLPSNTVYDLLHDSRGFLWVATENGIARFNGIEFTSYDHKKVRSKAVSGLFEDKFGRIWCHNFYGEILFIENDTLRKLDSWEGRYEEGFPTISNLGDSLLISTQRHIYSYDLLKKQWRLLDSKIANRPTLIRYHAVHDRETWVCATIGAKTFIKSLSADGQELVIPKRDESKSPTLFKLNYWRGKTRILNIVDNELYELRNDTIVDVSSAYRKQLAKSRSIKSLGDSIFAFYGNQGIELFYKNSWIALLNGKNVSSVSSDSEGSLWVSTLNEGIFFFPNLFTTIFSKTKHGLFTKLAFDSIHHRLFAGKYNGQVDVIDSSGIVKTIFTSNQKEIQSLYVDQESKQLLVFSDRLYFFDLTSFQKKGQVEIGAVKSIIKLKGFFYLATSGGVYLLNPSTHLTTRLPFDYRTSRMAFVPTTNELWIGTQKGVMIYAFETNKQTWWKPDSATISPGVSAMELLPDNQLIIGTLTDGVYQLSGHRLLNKITKMKGLPSDHVTALSYHQGKIWIGTDRGLCSYTLEDKTLFTLDAAKGLAGNEVYSITASSMGLWVSHSEGLQYFKQLPGKNTSKPMIHLKQVTSDGKSINNFIREIRLQPLSRQLTITFDVSNDLKGRGTTMIRYRVKGIDLDRWNEVSLAAPVANFLSIPSGNHTLEVVALNEDGVLSSNRLLVPVIAMAPFWETRWFIFFAALLLLTGISSILYFRLKRLGEINRAALVQQNLSQELRIAQLTSIRAQMNPHFVFNTLAHIQSQVLKGMKEAANQSIQDFSSLLRKVLDFSSKELIPLQDEIEVLQKYLSIEKDRFDGSLQYEIAVAESVRNEMVRIPSLLTQPFVENALRHGLMHRSGVKELTIRFDLENDCLVILIRDNGIGRKASAEFNKARKKDHQSFALEAYSRRIDLLNASRDRKIELAINDHYNELGAATGTSVYITIPLEDEPARKK
jgi:ligand-binding sensor domain-containing protein